MKRKLLIILLLTVSAVLGALAFSACKPQVGDPSSQHVHDWGEWEVTTPATCSSQGVETRTCKLNSNHKQTRSTAVDLTAHNWNEWEVTTPATCSSKGVETRTCRLNRNHKQTRKTAIDPTAHKLKHVEAQEATCVTKGWNEHDECELCHKKIGYVETAAFNHKYEWHAEKPATCVEAGMHEHFQCINCLEYFDSNHQPKELSELIIQADPTAHKFGSALDRDRYAHFRQCENCKEKFDVVYHNFDGEKTCAECRYVADYTFGLAFEPNSDGTTCTLTGIGTATDTDIVIPDKYYDETTNTLYTVTDIISSVFANKTVNSVVVPDSITTISKGAFADCVGLTSITLPFVGKSKSAYGYEGVLGYVFDYVARTQSSTVDNATYQYHSSSNYYYYFIPQTLTSVTITGGKINTNAFYNCANLTAVTIGEGVTTIGSEAFYNCTNLTTVTIGEGVTTIGSEAFYNCANLTTVTIGEGVTTIGSDAFYNCNKLLTIHIPASVTNIYSSAFTNCNGLQYFTVESGNKKYVAYEGIIYNYNITDLVIVPKDLRGEVHIHANIKQIGSRAFEGRTNLTGIFMENVNTIGGRAFYGCTSLTTLTLPEGLTRIAEYTFYNCEKLNDITIPDGVTSIGDYAFYGCSAFTELYIPQNVETIGNAAFAYCGFDTISVDDRNATFISKDNCLIERRTNILVCGSNSGEIPADVNVTEILPYAFSGCDTLAEIIIPDSVTSIGSYAFSGCTNLNSINIPDGVTSIGSSAFSGCSNIINATMPAFAISYIPKASLQTVVITSGDSIDRSAFDNCTSLTSITIPNSVTSIGSYAFRNCTSLKSITIPDGVTSIGSSAFYDCTSIEGVYITDLAAWCNIEFSNYSANPLSYAHNLYLDNKPVTDITADMLQGVTEIKYCAFLNCTSLESINIPDSVISIGFGAFSGCTKLESITIPFIEDGYFGYIFGAIMYQDNSEHVPTSLKTVVITGGKSISWDAFSNCTSLESITIPDSVTSIGYCAFRNCTSLKSITIPFVGDGLNETLFGYIFGASLDSEQSSRVPASLKTVKILGGKTIGDSAFSFCKNLTNIIIPDSVTSIGQYAFYYCTSLTSITIPDSVTFIGSSAFEDCSSLESITIPDSVTSIGYNAFYKCTSLATVYYGGDNTQWNSITIGSDNDNLKNATRYYFSETAPDEAKWAESENWWHYDPATNKPVVWTKEEM